MRYYEEYFNEPSEFEEQIIELKETLAESIVGEFNEKLRRLEKENAELREFRDKKAEYDRIIRQKDREIEQAKEETLKKRLTSIFGELLAKAYRPTTVRRKYKKCNRCDDNRRIYFKTPTGRDSYESCVCDNSVYLYVPKEVQLASFNVDKDSCTTYYEQVDSQRDYDRYDLRAEVYRGGRFEDIKSFHCVFLDLEECKQYCDWLNKQKFQENQVYASKWGLVLEEENQ